MVVPYSKLTLTLLAPPNPFKLPFSIAPLVVTLEEAPEVTDKLFEPVVKVISLPLTVLDPVASAR